MCEITKIVNYNKQINKLYKRVIRAINKHNNEIHIRYDIPREYIEDMLIKINEIHAIKYEFKINSEVILWIK